MRYYTFRRQVPKLKPGQRIDFRRGHGYFVIPAPRKIAPPKPPAPVHPTAGPSMFSGRGLFTTSDTDSALGYNADWTAIQLDPEGDESVANVPGILCYWQARPTTDIVAVANDRRIPYIAQAESDHELAIAVQCAMKVPHALIGNPGTWSDELRKEAVAKGWDLILEWYWNNTPSYDEPNADGYPLFRNVCFGTFASETVPGRRVYVDEYRAIWHGPFSIWDTEGATGRDRVAYNA